MNGRISLLRMALGVAMLVLLVWILANEIVTHDGIDRTDTVLLAIVVSFLGFSLGVTSWPDVTALLRVALAPLIKPPRDE